MTVETAEFLERCREDVERTLARAWPEAPPELARLHEAMRYSLDAGGKRLRPALCLAACEAVGGAPEAALPVAAALELVHTYSLIHDDLPCMDDDDLRRGRPTNHRVFGEALAVLAGDALLTRAFGILAEEGRLAADVRIALVADLARSAGSLGMVGGQALDLAAEGRPVDAAALRGIHARKTGALIAAACRMGGRAGGASPEDLARLERFGERVGLAFQIADDLLDETATPEELGKASRKDRERGKATYPGLLGQEESRARLREAVAQARDGIAPLGERGSALIGLARFVAERTS
jgi:geranylgeranyl diphosphate synthase type II